jgi:protein ImuB
MTPRPRPQRTLPLLPGEGPGGPIKARPRPPKASQAAPAGGGTGVLPLGDEERPARAGAAGQGTAGQGERAGAAAAAAARQAAPAALPRRVLALYLPDLPCELAALPRESALGVAGALLHDVPLAVVLAGSADELRPTSRLHGVTARARRLGVSSGQTVAAARTLVGDLDVRRLSPQTLEAALSRFAEMALAHAPLAQVLSPDTVLLDITGCAHLSGGEESLLAEVCERVRQLGHRVRGAIASGPVTARAVARFASMPQSLVPPGFETAALAPLPLRALPLDDETHRWFLKVGVLTIGDLARQPRAATASRLYPPPPPQGRQGKASPRPRKGDGTLAARAAEVLALLAGQDSAPLVAHSPPRVLHEQVEWDDPVEGVEPLVLALRGLIARISARLEGRGESTPRVDLTLHLDASIAGLRGASPRVEQIIELPLPLSHAAELLSVVRARIESLRLAAPVRRAELTASRLERTPRVQLDLSRDRAPSPDALPLLLAELSAELGEGRVGVLSLQNSHIPESRGRLSPVIGLNRTSPDRAGRASRPRARAGRKSEPGQPPAWPEHAPAPPTRLLDVPVTIQGRVNRGGFVTIENTPFTVQQVVFAERLDDIGWWTGAPQSRDYAFVWLAGEEGGAEAWVMRDRRRKKIFLHGWFT